MDHKSHPLRSFTAEGSLSTSLAYRRRHPADQNIATVNLEDLFHELNMALLRVADVTDDAFEHFYLLLL